MIKAKVVGAGGFGGLGISELLRRHPEAEIACLVDVENVGKPLSALYPHLEGYIEDIIFDPSSSEAAAKTDVVFMATPDGVGMKLARTELEKGAKVIDYSGDFRFNTSEAYADYAGRLGRDTHHAAADLLPGSVYGLAELHRHELTPETNLVGNPGCFAVSCILGLVPAVKTGLIRLDSIICDCKTGVSGAGKKPAPVFHYPARYENMNPYKLAGHQHVCEVERELSILAGSGLNVTFTAQVVPLCRGIMSSLYGRLTEDGTEADILSVYRDFYAESPFVLIHDSSAPAGTQSVRATNRCALTVSVDQRTGVLRVVSCIDNLVKGQAGSALQNMNLLFGLPESMGLDSPGVYP